MATCPVRSISLPSRSHPLTLSIEEQLEKLKASKSSSICHKLGGLKDLFECVDDFLHLQLTRQTLSHEWQSESVEQVLDGSLSLLDMCDITRVVLSQIKECVQELELSLRRRRGTDSSLTSEVDAYLASRKKLNKVMSKCLNLKRKEKNRSMASFDKNFNLMSVIVMLRGVEEISVAVLESILSSISQTKAKTKPSVWSVVSNLLQSKRVSCQGEVNANEAEKIDAELLDLKSSKDINSVQVQRVLKRLEALESSIQEVEEELECVYRRLVKMRASLLNILNN